MSNDKRLRAVSFDADGTLFDSFSRQFRWFKHWAALNKKAFPYDDSPESLNEFRASYNALCHSRGIQGMYDALGLPCDINDRKNHPVWPAYDEYKANHPVGLHKGVKAALRNIWKLGRLGPDPSVNSALRMIINTSNSWGSIHSELAAEGVLHYFDGQITYDVLAAFHGNGNPNSLLRPSKVPQALALMFTDCDDGSELLHVGDTLGDLSSSRKVLLLDHSGTHNIRTVGVTWGFDSREVLERGVVTPYGTEHFDYIVDNPSELVKIVRGLRTISL